MFFYGVSITICNTHYRIKAMLKKFKYMQMNEYNILGSYRKCSSSSSYNGEVKIELQSQLDHTASGILELKKSLLESLPADSLDKLTLITKCNFITTTSVSFDFRIGLHFC